MINQNSSTIHIPSEKMLMELASMPKSIQFAALSYVKGKWENMYPATTAEQVTTDDNHQFVTKAQIEQFGAKSQISIGETEPTEPKEGAIWFDTSVPVTEPTE